MHRYLELSGGVAYRNLSSEEKIALKNGNKLPNDPPVHCKACETVKRGVHATQPHVCLIGRNRRKRTEHWPPVVYMYMSQTGADIRRWTEVVDIPDDVVNFDHETEFDRQSGKRRSRRKRKHPELFVSQHRAAQKGKTKPGTRQPLHKSKARKAGQGVLHCLDTMLNYGPRAPALFPRRWHPMLIDWVHTWPELLRLYMCERLNVSAVYSGPQPSGLARCRFLFDVLLTKKFSRPFMRPVDLSRYSDYLHYVSEPLHLLAIKERLQARVYTSHTEFATDVRRVALNCMLYNAEGSSYYEKAEAMLSWFTSAYQELVCATQPFVDSNPVGSEIGDVESPDEACSTAIEIVRAQLAKELGLQNPEMPIIISMQRVMTPSSVLKLYVKVQFSAHPQGSLTHVCLTKDYSFSRTGGYKLHHVQEGKLLSDPFTAPLDDREQRQDVEESARGLGARVPPNLRFQLFLQTRAQLAGALEAMGTLEFRDWPLPVRVNTLSWLCDEACTLPIIREFMLKNDEAALSKADSQWYSRQRLRFRPLGVDARGRQHWVLRDPQGLSVPRVLYVHIDFDGAKDGPPDSSDLGDVVGTTLCGWRSFSGPDTVRMYARSLDHTVCPKQKRLRRALFKHFPDSRKVFEPRSVHKRRSPETVMQDLLDLEALLCHGGALLWRSHMDDATIVSIDAENKSLFSDKPLTSSNAEIHSSAPPSGVRASGQSSAPSSQSQWRDWSQIGKGWRLSLTRAMPLDYTRGKSTQPKLYELKGAALVHVELRILWPNDGKWSVLLVLALSIFVSREISTATPTVFVFCICSGTRLSLSSMTREQTCTKCNMKTSLKNGLVWRHCSGQNRSRSFGIKPSPTTWSSCSATFVGVGLTCLITSQRHRCFSPGLVPAYTGAQMCIACQPTRLFLLVASNVHTPRHNPRHNDEANAHGNPLLCLL